MSTTIRIYPHRVAGDESVSAIEWWLERNGERYQCPQLLEGWDYSVSLTFGVNIKLDLAELVQTSALDPTQIAAVMLLECQGTGIRRASSAALASVDPAEIELAIDVPAGSVASDLRLSVHLIATVEGSSRRHGSMVPAGSRLWSSEAFRVVLEGDTGRFPTEVAEFRKLGYPDAPWALFISYETLSDSFMGSVRLVVNTEHSVGRALLDRQRGAPLQPILRADVLRLLIARLSEDIDQFEAVPDEESIAGVADGMTRNLLGRSLPETVSEYEMDPLRFEMLVHERLNPLKEVADG